MKVGMLVAMQNHPNNSQADHHLYWDECRLADLAEPLGFDSLWAVEHHFDNSAMIPDAVQFLTYMAGRTTRTLVCQCAVKLTIPPRGESFLLGYTLDRLCIEG